MSWGDIWVSVNNSRIIAGVIPAFIAALSVYFTWKSYKSSHEAAPPALLRFDKWVDVYKKIKDSELLTDDKELEDALELHKDAALWETKVIKKTYPGRIRDILLEQNILSPRRESELLWFPIWKFQKLKMVITIFLILVFILDNWNNWPAALFIVAFFVFDTAVSWVSMYKVANRYYKSIEHNESEEGTRWLELYSLLFNGLLFVSNNINNKKAHGLWGAIRKYSRMLSYYIACVIFTNYVNIFSVFILIVQKQQQEQKVPQEAVFGAISSIYMLIYIFAYLLYINKICYPDIIRYPNRYITETKIKKLGIKKIKEDDEEIFDQLLALTPKKYDNRYPSPLFGADYYFRNKGLLIIFSFTFFIFITCFLVSLFTGSIVHWDAFEYSLFLIGADGICAGVLMIGWFLCKRRLSKNIIMEKNIIFRNGYYALRDEYLLDSKNKPKENNTELEERKKFENTDVYKEWKDKIKKEHPEWTSWNYGLSISQDNNPEKVKFDELEDDDSVDSEPESPALIQKLLRVRIFSRKSQKPAPNPSSGA